MENSNDNVDKTTEDFDIKDFFEDVLNNADSIQKPQTFLSTIGKSYHETYLSKILLYVLTQQKCLLARLINNYAQKQNAQKQKWENWVDVVEDKLEVVRACTEMSMNGGRADVFLELKYNNDRITFTVENKCYAAEHNTGDDISQTQTYADYINTAYAGSKNVFYYLKPEFNPSQATCKDFITITYSELNNYIDVSKDYLINDFKIHIGEFLVMNFNDIEKTYLQNNKTIKDFIIGAEKKRNDFIGNVIESFMQYMQDPKNEFKKSFGEVEFEIVDNKTVLKVYHKDWKTDDYHFYSEIKFEGGSLTNVICQNTAYANKKAVGILHEYMQKKKNKDYHCNYEQWYIFEGLEHFSSSEDFLSDNWIEKLKSWAAEKMPKYYGNMSIRVNEFLEWKKNQNIN